MNFLALSFQSTDNIAFFHDAFFTMASFSSDHARAILGLAIVLVSFHVFKPILKGLLHAAVLLVRPRLSRDQKTAQRNFLNMVLIRNMLREREVISPSMAAELSAISARA